MSRYIDALRNDLETRAAADAFSGSVAVTVAGDTVFEQAYGYANRAWHAPAGVSTRYDTASITKLFTAVAVLRQVERGTFGLDEPVIGYLELPDTAIPPEVTVRHLLTHSSGIADDADEEAGESWDELFRDRPTYAFTELAHHLPNFAGKPPNFAPGTGIRYCNAGFLLLGMMVEKATGRRYRDYVTDAVFAPAGMTGAGFFRMDVVEPDVAEAVEPILDGDTITGWRRNIFSYPPVGDAAGGAYASVRDLLAFHRAALGGHLVNAELTAAMFTPQVIREPDADGLRHANGFAVEMTLDPDGAVRRHWKEGVNTGTSGMLRHYPREDVTIALLAVGEDAAWEPIRTFERALD